MPKQVLVTAALPYANGSIHLGHLLGYVQTDVYVRARKLAGDDCIFMWADDTHGTPVQVRARKEGITPEALIERAYEEHSRDLSDFGLDFDIFHTTHSEESRRQVHAIFETMRARGGIEVRDVAQLYCPTDEMFLPDRFVKGTCPRCKAADQYGDSCEVCGSTYSPTELGDPRCAECGTTPTSRNSEHLFVSLARHEAFLREWIERGGTNGESPLQPSVRNYVMDWVEGGLRDWDISRDAPYFGIEIPGFPGKYFYVWFDAPIGYIAATQRYCDQTGRDFDAYWHDVGRANTELVHVIGKDIVYFHCLFWPAVLNATDYTIPSKVQVHGWLTVNGEKMSKSRGTFILARTYLDHLSPDYLRYYFAAKLGASQEDFDLNVEDFVNRCNADLVKKAANLASRCIKFMQSKLGGELGVPAKDAEPLLERAGQRLSQAESLYRNFDSGRALRLAMEVAEDFNLYLSETAPWKLAQTDPERATAICTAGILASKVVAAILKPVLPGWAARVETMLHLPAPLDFHNGAEPLPPGHPIGPYEVLAQPVDPAMVAAMIEASKETMNEPVAQQAQYEVEALADEATIEQFSPVDLRVGKVVACEAVEGAAKLLRLTVDLGPLGQRNVFSGIAKSYAPEQLVGKHVVVFANLKPRKMRFGVSEGMILASGASDDTVIIVELDPKSRPGDKVT